MKNIGIAIRSLFKRGQHNVMKIISLGIGLTIGLVLIAKVHFENTYDNFYPDGDRIYRVYEKFFMNGINVSPYRIIEEGLLGSPENIRYEDIILG